MEKGTTDLRSYRENKIKERYEQRYAASKIGALYRDLQTLKIHTEAPVKNLLPLLLHLADELNKTGKLEGSLK